MRTLLFGVFLFGLLFFPASALYAADFSFSPSSGSHGVGEEFSVKVQVNPGGQSINAADGTVSFDTTTLAVSSVSRDGSSFSLWTSDPVYSNSAGTVVFSGGTPTAFTNQGNVFTIKFRAKAVGSGKVSVSKGAILAADGKGSDVYTPGSDATYTITEAAEKPEPAPSASSNNDVPAVAAGPDVLVPYPDVTSSTHKKADQWAATSTAILSWKIPPDVLSVRTGISKDPDVKPTKVYTPAIDTQTFENLADGVWYFSAQFKDDFEWGGVTQREVRVDTTMPEEYDIALLDNNDGTPKFVLGTTDELSGMNRYEIYLNDTIAVTAREQDLIDKAFPIPPQEGGDQKVTVKAYDNAGNVREVTKQMEVPFVAKPTPKGAEPVATTDSGFRIEWIVIALFAFAIGGLVAWQVQMKKVAEAEQAKILRRVLEIRERNDKVFAAMREEFEQIVNDFDEKPQLTAQERALLEKLREVLDISEEVVDSDIEDLKKLIKNQ